jgi:hypothetical protein
LKIEKKQPPFKKKKAIEKNRRRTKRFAFRHTLYLGRWRPPEHKSFAKDFSDKGIGLKTYMAFNPGTRLYMSIKTDDKIYKADGFVVWIKKVPPGLVQLIKTDMGIKFTHVDQELVDLYEEKFKAELAAHGLLDVS